MHTGWISNWHRIFYYPGLYLVKAPAASQYPRQILIGAAQIPYSIVFIKDKSWLGKCSLKKRTIWLNAKQPRTHLFMTFLHELLHAIEFESGMKIKHQRIYEFEDGLYNFFINNVSLFGFGQADD